MTIPIPFRETSAMYRDGAKGRRRKRRAGALNDWRSGLAITVMIYGIGGYIMPYVSNPSLMLAFVAPGCRIKGNVSLNTGERIYHVPGQEWYDETVISPRYGERWFCTEDEARQAGWRKSRG